MDAGISGASCGLGAIAASTVCWLVEHPASARAANAAALASNRRSGSDTLIGFSPPSSRTEFRPARQPALALFAIHARKASRHTGPSLTRHLAGTVTRFVVSAPASQLARLGSNLSSFQLCCKY